MKLKLRAPARIRKETILALEDPRFWLGLFSSFTQNAQEEPRFDAYTAALGVSNKESMEWWHKVTGWYEGIFDETDGAVEDPAVLLIDFSSSRSFRIEMHPGDVFFFFRDGTHEFQVGNIGPHWLLPFLRLNEAADLAQAALVPAGQSSEAWRSRVFLALLAGVWLTNEEEVAAGLKMFGDAYVRAGLGNVKQAASFGAVWINSVRAFAYPWREDPKLGWVSAAEWSSRFREKHAETARAVTAFLRKP